MTCGHVFYHNFISKANLKNPEQGFLAYKLYLPIKQKKKFLARPVFNLKGNSTGKWFCHICWGLGLWVVWWKSFRSVLFLSEKIDQERRALMTKWDLKLATWPLLAIGVNVQVHVFSATRGHVTNLRSHFVIRARRSWSIFSLRKENWPERLLPRHSPAQTLTYMRNSFFPWSSPLKATEFGAFFTYFHLFRYLKVVQLFKNCAKTFCFWQAFRQRKPLEDSPSGFKLAFSPIVMSLFVFTFYWSFWDLRLRTLIP